MKPFPHASLQHFSNFGLFFFNSLIHTFTQLDEILSNCWEAKTSFSFVHNYWIQTYYSYYSNIHHKAEIIRTAKSAISEKKVNLKKCQDPLFQSPARSQSWPIKAI